MILECILGWTIRNDPVTWTTQAAMARAHINHPAAPGHPGDGAAIGDESINPHGLYLFKTREEIVEYFGPNFHPPYNTPEKRKIISDVLSEVWDSPTLS